MRILKKIGRIIKITFSILMYIIKIPIRILDTLLVGGIPLIMFLFTLTLEVIIPLFSSSFVYFARFAPIYMNHDSSKDKSFSETFHYTWEAIKHGFIPASFKSFKFYGIPTFAFCAAIFIVLFIVARLILRLVRNQNSTLRYSWLAAKDCLQDVPSIWNLDSIRDAIDSGRIDYYDIDYVQIYQDELERQRKQNKKHWTNK